MHSDHAENSENTENLKVPGGTTFPDPELHHDHGIDGPAAENGIRVAFKQFMKSLTTTPKDRLLDCNWHDLQQGDQDVFARGPT